MEKLKIGITHGNTNGVGYEVILKAFEDPTTLELCTPVVYGSPKVATYHRKAIGSATNFYTIQNVEEAQEGHLNVLECITDEVKIDLGQQTEEAQRAAEISRAAAEKDLGEGKIDALVYAPGDTLPQNGLTLLLGEHMRVAIATSRQPLGQVAQAITKEHVSEKIKAFELSLKRDFGLTRPRIAVLQLNPEAGTEETEAIVPSIQDAEAERISAFGPFSPDSLFSATDYRHYDGILAMHYEQALTPLKMLCNDYNIFMQAGLETVATAPLHEAQFSIAGRGEADITPFCNALYAAIDACRSRIAYDEARENTLPKLFHDKREDNRRPAASPE